MQIPKASHKFFPQLEGFRAIAIALVVTTHWMADHNPYEYWIRWAGNWGITYFFVLSGFLIGNILLKEKEQLQANKKATILQVLKIFYARRVLRIFPIYYILLIALLIIGFPDFIYDLYGWLFLYASNLYIFEHGWIWPLTHLWTLSVEEHFIILFPFLILFTPSKYILPAIISLALVGIACRTGLYLNQHPYYQIFTFSCFDSLALGAILSYFRFQNKTLPWLIPISALALALYIFLPLPQLYFTGKTLLKVMVPSAAIFSMGIVYYASIGNGITGFMRHLFQNKLVVYIGKIGYGLYLYHMFIPYLRIYICKQLGIEITIPFIFYGLDTLLLLLLATISFYAIENPIYSLKKHFQYKHANVV